MLTAAVRPVSVFADGYPVATVPIVENAKAGKYKFQVGDGRNLSDWVYIDNVARAHLLVAQALIRSYAVPTSTIRGQRINGEAFFGSQMTNLCHFGILSAPWEPQLAILRVLRRYHRHYQASGLSHGFLRRMVILDYHVWAHHWYTYLRRHQIQLHQSIFRH